MSVQHMSANKVYSSSLERSGNRLSHQSFYLDGSQGLRKQSRLMAPNQKRPLSQDTILENPNTLFSTGSNDDFAKAKNSSDRIKQNR